MVATASPTECLRWQLRRGDVLFTKDSETPDEIGIPAFVTEDMPGVLCGYHLARARPNGELVNGAFLTELIRSPRVSNAFARVSNGVTRFGLTLGAANSLPILLPPLPEQRAIAAVLDSIDGAIERKDDVIAATERLRDALLHELLARGVPGWHSAWKDVPGLGTMPASWEVVRLGDVAEFQQGGTPPKSRTAYWEGHIPFVTGADLKELHVTRQNARSFLTEEGLNSGATVICKPGSLLLATRTRVGLVGIASETMGASQDITLIAPSDQTDTSYLYRLLTSKADSLQRRSRGTTIQGVSREDIASLHIPLPSLPEQQAIASMLDAVDEAVEQARRERAGLQDLKASTSDALLKGRVRVAS